MSDEPQRPYLPTSHSEAISLRDYFESLRRADGEHMREQLSQLELRLQQRFDAQEKSISTAMIAAEKAVSAALIASEKAVEKAEGAQGLRNAQQNEWRGSLEDLSARMWTREEGSTVVTSLRRELTIRMDGIEAKVDEDRRRSDKGEGSNSGTAMAVTHRYESNADMRGLIAVGISVLSVAFIIFRAATGH